MESKCASELWRESSPAGAERPTFSVSEAQTTSYHHMKYIHMKYMCVYIYICVCVLCIYIYIYIHMHVHHTISYHDMYDVNI